MRDKYYRERAWIRKKLNSGVSKSELYHSVGVFSNKPKRKVMKEKGLTEVKYKKRYNFLFNVYNILSDESNGGNYGKEET